MGIFGRKKAVPACGAVIVAAGTGTRMQGIDKILTPLAGVPVIVRTVSAFQSADCIREIVVVVRAAQQAQVAQLLRESGLSKVLAVVPGGETRVDSVRNGLKALSRDVDLAAIQDGARPLVTEEIIAEAVKKAAVCHAAAPAVPLKDTIKTVDDGSRVISTPDRAGLRAVQTPQVFQRDLLMAAWEKARKDGKEYTDDCGAMEALGVPVYLTPGSEENLKLTTPLDLCIAEAILNRRETI